MKQLLLLLSFLMLITASYAQKTKVYSSPAFLIKKNITAPQGLTLKASSNTNVEDYIIAYKKGFITQGEYIKNILKKGDKFTFIPKEIPSEIILDKEKISNIKFSRLKYKTDNYYYNISDSEGKKMMDNINIELQDLGFKVNMLKQTLFEEKIEKVDFNIGAEIISTYVKTIGTAGYNVSTVVKWVVFDMNKKKVVLNKKSFGYSNSKKAKQFTEEYILALRDAMNTLIHDKEFQEIISTQSSNTEEEDNEETLDLNFKEEAIDSVVDMLSYIKQATVTIRTNTGHGSGFFITNDGYILTNDHVIKNTKTIEIELSSGLIIDAKVIRQNSDKDVALLKVIGKGFKAIPIYDGKANAGLEVYAVGTPADTQLGQTVTKGIVSGTRNFEGNTLIQTDVSISSGNSGGPLVNLKGEVLGIVSSKLVGDGIEGIGFGIPILKAIKTLNIKY